MSLVIIGGNECMERRYSQMCSRYGWKSKVFCKPQADMKNRIGKPDMLILFTHTVSHKLVQSVLPHVSQDTSVVRSHSSSLASLQSILEENTAAEA